MMSSTQRQFVMTTLFPVIVMLVLGLVIIYLLFGYMPSPAPPARQAIVPGASLPLDQRVRNLEGTVQEFERLHAQTLEHAERAGWFSEKILRLIAVVSVIGTFMTLLGYFSLSTLKATADEAKNNLVTAQQGFEVIRQRMGAVKDQILARSKSLGLERVGGAEDVFVESQPINYEVEYYDVTVAAWEVHETFEWSIYATLGVYLLSTGQKGKALARLNKAIESNPAAFRMMYLKGLCLGFLSQDVEEPAKSALLTDAGRAFQAAYNGDRESPVFCLGMGWYYDEIKDYPEARVWYEEALKRKPGFVPATNNMGCAFAKEGKPREAYETILPIKNEPSIRRALLSEGEQELKSIREWDPAKFAELLS